MAFTKKQVIAELDAASAEEAAARKERDRLHGEYCAACRAYEKIEGRRNGLQILLNNTPEDS